MKILDAHTHLSGSETGESAEGIVRCLDACDEAMAAGRAVAATDVGGTPEVVMHTVDGWLVPPNDPLALAQTLLMLLGDPVRRAKMGAAVRQKVAAQFTRDCMVHETLSFYQRILASR